MRTRTKFVILMHPHEFKRIKANTGRLTHLCLAGSEVHIGESFETHDAVRALIDDPKNYPVLLYPGRDALDLSVVEKHDPQLTALNTQLEQRTLVVFLLDATWRLVRPMLRLSPNLQRLPRIMFSNAAPSRYLIKKQPEPGCLSTLEATHELLLALDRSGLDRYTMPEQLLSVFMRMQEIQITRTAENRRLGIQRHAPKPKRATPPAVVSPGKRRKKIFPRPESTV